MVKYKYSGCTFEAEEVIDYKPSNLELFLGTKKRVDYALKQKNYSVASKLQETLIKRYESLFADSFKEIDDSGIDYKNINRKGINYLKEWNKNKQSVDLLTDSDRIIKDNFDILNIYAKLKDDLSEYKCMADYIKQNQN